MTLKEKIIEEVRKIYDPELPVNIYELGLIYDIKVENDNTAKVKMIDKWYLGMLNIGTNPTVNGQQQSIELHIIGWSGNLYDQRIQVALLDRIRDEVKFDSMAELQEQLEKDKDFILTAYKTLTL